MARQWLVDWVVPHLCTDKPGEQLGRETDNTTQVSSVGKESLKTYSCKNLWGLQRQEKLPASQERSSERPTRL